VLLSKERPDERAYGDDLQSLRVSGVDRRFRESGSKTTAALRRRHLRVQQCEGVRTPLVNQDRGLTVNDELELVSFAVVGDCRRLRFNARIDLSHHAPSYCGRRPSLQGTKGTTDVRPDEGPDRAKGSLIVKKMLHPSTLWPTSTRPSEDVPLCTRRPAPYDVLR
jgi:hypothetical protein